MPTSPFGSWAAAGGRAHYYLSGAALCGARGTPAPTPAFAPKWGGMVPVVPQCPECLTRNETRWAGMQCGAAGARRS